MRTYLKTVFLLVILAVFSSCAAKKEIADDHGVMLHDELTSTVKAYFTAKIENDMEKMYEYIDPAAKKQISLEGFIVQQGRWADMKLAGFSIGQVTFKDKSSATVEVLFKLEDRDVPTYFPFIYKSGNWYRHYPTYETDIR